MVTAVICVLLMLLQGQGVFVDSSGVTAALLGHKMFVATRLPSKPATDAMSLTKYSEKAGIIMFLYFFKN